MQATYFSANKHDYATIYTHLIHHLEVYKTEVYMRPQWIIFWLQKGAAFFDCRYENLTEMSLLPLLTPGKKLCALDVR
jgi:hypothetical protein